MCTNGYPRSTVVRYPRPDKRLDGDALMLIVVDSVPVRLRLSLAEFTELIASGVEALRDYNAHPLPAPAGPTTQEAA